jgi:hypothetical protein
MKKKLILWALALCPLLALGQGNNWKLDGNNNAGSTGFLGTTNKTDLRFKTNNQTRLTINSDGNIEAMKDLRVHGALYVGDSTVGVFDNSWSQLGGIALPTSEVVTAWNGRLAFGQNVGSLNAYQNDPVKASSFSLGIGSSYHSFKVQISQQTADGLSSNEAVLGFTNENTGHFATDGFTLGLPTTGLTAVLNQQEFAPLQFNTRFGILPMNECRRMEIWGQDISVLNHTFGNITRVAISERGELPITLPRSLLHLGMDAPTNGGGWREWMDIGAYISGGNPGWCDNMYVGLKFFDINFNDPPPDDKAWSDRSDAVIAWGDNDATPTSPPLGPDNLRFIFTTPFTGAPTGSGSYEGLEVARITPWGNMGIGADFTNAFTPKRRLDIHDPGEAASPTSIGNPQLRLSQELNTNLLQGIYTDFQTTGNNNSYNGDGMGIEGHLLINPRSKGASRVVAINFVDNNTAINPNLSLDVNGQVNIRTVNPSTSNEFLVWDPTNGRVMRRNTVPGTSLGNICGASPNNPLQNDWEIPLYNTTTSTGHNFIFSGNANGANVNNVGIGINSCTPVAKLDILQSSGDLGTIGLNVVNNDLPDPFINKQTIGIKSVVTANNVLPYYNNAFKVAGWFESKPGWFPVFSPQYGFSQYAILVPQNGGMVSIGFPTTPIPTPFFNLVNFAVNGTFLNTGTSWGGINVSISDSCLKKDIANFSSGIDIIRQINTITYSFNGKSHLPDNKQCIGVIANNLKEFAPYAIDTIKLQLNPSDTFLTDIYGVKTDAILYTVVNAVKDIDSAVTILQQTVPPPKPILISPADSTNDLPLECTFTWHSAERATKYLLYISLSSGEIRGNEGKAGMSTMVISATDTFALVKLPELCRDYSWWVVAYNEAGASDVSETWTLGTYSALPPTAPLLAFPADSATNVPISTTLAWYPSENATQYRIAVFYDLYPKGMPVLIFEQLTSDTSVIVNLPQFGRKYLWNVTTTGCGANAYSDEWHFSTQEPQMPSIPVLISPENGDSLDNILALNFVWNSAENTRFYNLYVSTTPNESGIVYNYSIPDTFFTIYGPQTGKSYYWWVSACNDYTCMKSEMWSFYLYPYMGKTLSEPILSDSQYKTDVTPLSNSLEKVTSLNGVYFNWNTAQHPEITDTTRQIGFIAQQVEPVIPEVVSTDASGVKYVDYSRVVPVLTEAVKELKTQNDSLLAVIATYESRFTAIENMLAACCNETKSSSVNVTIETRPVVVPAQNTTLNQNYPNPFKTITTFTYTLGESGNCELVIEDTYGRTVATLVSENQQTGNYSVEWEASSQPAGIYFCSLRVNGKVLVKKAIKIE